MNTYEGYLFGHYDSRGGAAFIECNDEMKARERYIEMGQGVEETLKDAAKWANEPGAHEFWAELHAARDDRETVIRLLTEEDFITRATLNSFRPIEDGEDIEWGDGIPNPKANAFDEGLQWAPPEIEGTTANPYRELLWWNEGTKTLELAPAGVNPGTPNEQYGSTVWPQPERVPGWVRSSFGEDSCGMIFMKGE